METPYTTPEAELTNKGIDDTYQPRIFSISGRIGRMRYFGYSAYAMAIFYAVATPTVILADQEGALFGIAIALALICYVGVVFASFVLLKRRLNDLNKSGWMSLLLFVPFANIFIAFYAAFARGSDGSNNFGPAPNATPVIITILGLVVPLIVTIGVLAAIAIPAYVAYMEQAGI